MSLIKLQGKSVHKSQWEWQRGKRTCCSNLNSVPELTGGVSHLPVQLTPGDLTPSSSALCEHRHSHAHNYRDTKTHTILK